MELEINYQQSQELVKKYIGTIVVKSGNTKKLFILGFIGLNGVGKSFVAQKISERLGLYIASNDRIRRFLNEHGMEGVSPKQSLLQEIAESSTEYLLKNKISHVIDADLIEFHGVAQKNASKYGANLLLIHLICPEEIILKRLEDRSAEVKNNSSSNLSRVGVERYFERKMMHESLSLPKIFFTIDTSEELDKQINDLIDKLIREEVL